MSRNIAFWEKRRTAADKKLRELHKTMSGSLPLRRAPQRRSQVPDRTLSHRSHAKAYAAWKTENAKRRRLREEIMKLNRRVAYIDERIAALKAKTVWDTVRAGVL